MAQSKHLDIQDFLSKSLVCAICRGLFKTPKRVNCGHIFCLECLELLFQHSSENFPPCPVCRRRMVYPNDGVQHFPTQSFYEELVEYLNNSQKQSVNTRMCGLCENKRELQTRCTTCGFDMCETCTLTHSKLKPHCLTIPIDDVTDVSLDALMSTRNVTCKDHDDETLQFHCRKCDRPICRICKMLHHKKHKTQSLSETAEASRYWLIDFIKSLREKLKKAKTSEESIDRVLEKFDHSLQEQEQQLNEKIDNLIGLLESKRSSMLAEINHRKNDIHQRLKWQKEMAKSLQTELESWLEMTKNGISYGVDADVVFLHKEFKQNVKQMNTQLFALLDDQFHINVKLELNDTADVAKIINEYEVGKVQVDQQVSLRKCIKTNIHLQNASNISVASTSDNLCLLYQEKQGMLYASNRGLLYRDNKGRSHLKHFELDDRYFLRTAITHVARKENNYVMYHPVSLTLTEINPSSFLSEKQQTLPGDVHCYAPFTTDIAGNFVLYDVWNRRIVHQRENGDIIRTIENEFTYNRPLTMCTNSKNEFLLLGDKMCRVLHSDGNLKQDFQIQDAINNETEFTTALGCFDDHNNVITRVDLPMEERKVLMLNTERPWAEVLVLPELPNSDLAMVSSVTLKHSCVLYLLVNKLSNLMIVNYLPFIK